ncbi:AAA family ATPase [Desulfurobacterium sp.]
MLRLRHLNLEGFLSHKNTDLPFEDTSYIIIGSNASGKTSILRGIFFGLFGEDIVFGRRNLLNLVNREKSSAKITLSFLTGGREYTVIRKITPKGAQSVELFRDGNKLAMGVKVCEEVLRKELGLEPEIFKNTVYVPQGELVTFLEGTPKARREILNRLFGLEEIAKKHETIKAFAKQIEVEFSKFEFQLQQLENLQKKIISIEEEIKELERQIAEEEKETIEMKNLLSQQQKVLKSFEEKKSRVEAVEKEKRIYQEQLQKVISEIEKKKKKLSVMEVEEKKLPMLKEKVKLLPVLKEIEDKVSQLKLLIEKKKNLEEGKKRFELLKREFSKKKERLKMVERELSEAALKLKEAENVYKQKVNIYESLKISKSKHESLSEKLSYLKKEIEKREERFKKLPAVDLESLKGLISETDREISSVEKQIAETESLIKMHRERLEKLESKNINTCPICGSKLTADKIKNLISESSSFIEKHKGTVKTLQNKLKNLKLKKKREEENLKEAIVSLKERENLEKELISLKEERDAVQKELASLKFSYETFESIEKEVESMKETVLSLKSFISSLNGEMSRLKPEIEKIEEELKSFDADQVAKNIGAVDERTANLKASISELKSRFNIDVKSGKELKKAIEEIEANRREIERITAYLEARPEIEQEIELLSKELETLKEKLKNCEEKIKDIGYDEREHETIKKTVEDSEEKLSEALKALNQKRGTLMEKRETLAATKKEIEELLQVKDRIKVLKSAYDVIKQVEAGFHPSTGFVTELRQQLLPEIASICKNIFSEFNFDFSEITISEDLTVEFGIPGQGVVTLDQLSGGQKVAFALALRFALARKFMSKFELLILDEPTIHLDDERKRELADILLDLKGKIPQMVVVTHDPELEIAGDKIIRVEKTANGSTIKLAEGE